MPSTDEVDLTGSMSDNVIIVCMKKFKINVNCLLLPIRDNFLCDFNTIVELLLICFVCEFVFEVF